MVINRFILYSSSIFDNIKNILSKLPYIFYIIFFIVIMIIYFYVNSGLNLLNKIGSKNIIPLNKNINDDIEVLFKTPLVRLKYKDLLKILGEPTFENKQDYTTESVTWKLI